MAAIADDILIGLALVNAILEVGRQATEIGTMMQRAHMEGRTLNMEDLEVLEQRLEDSSKSARAALRAAKKRAGGDK